MKDKPPEDQGVPLEELFTHREIKGLEFERFKNENIVTDLLEPQTPLTDIIPTIWVVGEQNYGEFFNRYRRRNNKIVPHG